MKGDADEIIILNKKPGIQPELIRESSVDRFQSSDSLPE
jgi:hypothetical protein